MSLCMYLRKKAYPYIDHSNYTNNKITAKVVLETNYSTLTSFEVSPSSSFELGEVYWKRVNPIHDWFVNETRFGNDEERTFEISEDSLKDLLDICKEILKEKELNGRDSAILLAEETLPTRAGFSFETTEYQDYYFSTLERTITDVESLISIDVPKKVDGITFWSYYEYTSSW